jgi:hypothetical protein
MISIDYRQPSPLLARGAQHLPDKRSRTSTNLAAMACHFVASHLLIPDSRYRDQSGRTSICREPTPCIAVVFACSGQDSWRISKNSFLVWAGPRGGIDF